MSEQNNEIMTASDARNACLERELEATRRRVENLQEQVRQGKKKTPSFSFDTLLWVVGIVIVAGIAAWLLAPSSSEDNSVLSEELVELRKELSTIKEKGSADDSAAPPQEVAVTVPTTPATDSTTKVEKSEVKEMIAAALAARNSSSTETTTSKEEKVVEKEEKEIATTGDNRLDAFRLQYGTAMLHKDDSPPDLRWVDVDGIHIPIFRNPRMNGQWAFLTGDKVHGEKNPPTVTSPLEGRGWVLFEDPTTAPRVLNPDGQDMRLDLAIKDGALVFGTVFAPTL